MPDTKHPKCQHPKCGAKMQRIYGRDAGKWVPVGWQCTECKMIVTD